MNDFVTIVVLALMMLVLDAPWLYLNSGWVQTFVSDIQGGRSMQLRPWAGIPVYLALGYLVTQAKSAPRAFLLGLCTYAVYDFTQLFVFDKYPFEFAIADTLWGGTLMAITWSLAARFEII
jgi:uncharacterized membrane protein